VSAWKSWLYDVLSVRWQGNASQWRSLGAAIGVAMILIIPIAVSVHTVVSWIFAMTLRVPWNSTIFGAFFVAGAIFSGVATLILIMAVLRKVYHLEEYITEKHFIYLGYLLAAFALIMIYGNISEFLTAGYKLEAGEEQLHLEQARADEVVADVLRSVAPLVRGRDLKLVDRSSAVGVEADLTKLKQILINLLSNAIKYTHRGAITVSVGADPGSGEVRFAVADTGPGIAAQDGDRIFEPFTQLDGSNTRESSGIGLGLAIVKKYVEMHGGRVWFEPNPQGGTVFYFSLPATAAQTPNGPANGHHALTLQEEEQSQR